MILSKKVIKWQKGSTIAKQGIFYFYALVGGH